MKCHSTINSANEYEPDVLNTFSATQVQRMYELISVCILKELIISICTFTSSLTVWSQFISNMLPCAQRRMQMSQNVNNNISKNTPIARRLARDLGYVSCYLLFLMQLDQKAPKKLISIIRQHSCQNKLFEAPTKNLNWKTSWVLIS